MGEEQGQTGASGLAHYRDPAPFSHRCGEIAFTFYPSGKDRREALLELLRSAKRTLKLCFYIFMEDAVSTEVRDSLRDAADRGVKVTVILDRFGSETSEEFLAPLREAGATCRYFSDKFSHRYLIRNHQKIVIADDERAMFGGFNIEDDYFAPPEENGWNDLAIRIDGKPVEGLVDWFAKLDDWTARPDARFREIRHTVRGWSWSEGDTCWLVGGPTKGLSSWAGEVTKDLGSGSKLDMFMAYFSPPKKLLQCIGQIASKGETRLLMAGKSDNAATLGATRSLYDYLLRKGAKIWEFSPCKLHTKLLVVDDTVYFGSANFDMRSLYLNLELMLRVEDAELAQTMHDFVSQHIAASEAITPEVHKKRATLWNRVRWNLGWLLVSVLDYTVSRRLNLGL